MRNLSCQGRHTVGLVIKLKDQVSNIINNNVKCFQNDEHEGIEMKSSSMLNASVSLLDVADCRPEARELCQLIMIMTDCVNKGPDLRSEGTVVLPKSDPSLA